MKLLKEFCTTQCDIKLYDTEFKADLLKIYCIKSFHRSTQKTLTRFGTKKQIDSMLKPYNLKKRFTL